MNDDQLRNLRGLGMRARTAINTALGGRKDFTLDDIVALVTPREKGQFPPIFMVNNCGEATIREIRSWIENDKILSIAPKPDPWAKTGHTREYWVALYTGLLGSGLISACDPHESAACGVRPTLLGSLIVADAATLAKHVETYLAHSLKKRAKKKIDPDRAA